MLVILDSSMLMLPLEKKINVSLELERLLPVSFEIVIPKIVVCELERIMRDSPPSTQRKAKLALELANKYRILDSNTEGLADDELEKLAIENNSIVATNDSELRSKLREKGVAVITLHGKNKLALFGYIDG
ncbi:MAG: 30S processome protein Utp24 [Candidatus Heimdallarchaeota archaeon]|nr:30S processome protein Utp24 [Candidatus Heimdallarchaeota archaeon]MCK4768906.1 30S processome protein Utp24 [Candidatus Heimdallarchaeota archaeon]